MIPPGLIQFVLYLVGPFVLINFVRGHRSKDNSVARKNRLSKVDYITYGSLLGLALVYMYMALGARPANVFKTIDAIPGESCHALRKKFATYVEENPSIIPPGGIPTSTDKSMKSFDSKLYYTGSEYGHIDFLVDRFCRYAEDVDIYLKFGEDAFMNSVSSDFGPKMISPRNAMPNGGKGASRFLTDLPDIGFLLYAVASMFFSYLPAFLLVGILTTPFTSSKFAPSRVYARPWGVIMLGTLLFSDFYWMITVPTATTARASSGSTVWIFSPDHRSAVLFFADSATYTRHMFLATSLIAFLVIDYVTSSRQTDIQLLKHAISEAATVFVSAKNQTMLNSSIMMSDRLRDRYVARYKQEQKATEAVFADEEFEQKYQTLAKQTNSKHWAEKTAAKTMNDIGL
ncbi:hypothetical protein LPJ59_004338 [Coemansia sp. RSA 2399]|nr:hypothetical protein LPJ59_004338 [Coemansia sp. RSA 2399]